MEESSNILSLPRKIHKGTNFRSKFVYFGLNFPQTLWADFFFKKTVLCIPKTNWTKPMPRIKKICLPYQLTDKHIVQSKDRRSNIYNADKTIIKSYTKICRYTLWWRHYDVIVSWYRDMCCATPWCHFYSLAKSGKWGPKTNVDILLSHISCGKHVHTTEDMAIKIK